MIEWIITSSLLILIVIGLRRVLRGRISPALQYALWLLVLVRLLVPVSLFDSRYSLMSTIESSSGYRAAENFAENTKVYSDIIRYTDMPYDEALSAGHGTLHRVEGYTQESGYGHLHSYTYKDSLKNVASRVLTPVWLVGMVVVALYFLAANLHLSAKLRRSRKPLESDGKLTVYISGAVDTPCLFGLVKPKIYLTPDAAESETVCHHAIAHETTHYLHCDHIWSVLRGICLAIHWYNPLVWWAAALSRRDAELCCDEATIRRIGESQRAEYGRTLIAMTCRERTHLLLTATTMTGSAKSIKERILLIAKKPKMTAVTVIAVTVVALIAVGCAFTGSVDSDESENNTGNSAASTPGNDEQTGDNEQTGKDTDDTGSADKNTEQEASLDPELFGITEDDLACTNSLPDWDSYTLPALFSYVLNTDGAGAEGSISELYRRFIEVPGDIFSCLSVYGDLPARSGSTAAEELMQFIAYHAYWMDDGKALESALNSYTPTSSDAETNASLLGEFLNMARDEFTVTNVDISLGVADTLKGLTEDDISYTDFYVDAQNLVSALNSAAEYETSGDSFDVYGYWMMTVYLEGGPDAWSSNDKHITLTCGLTENLVRVNLSKGMQHASAYFENEELYRIVRGIYDYTEYVDEEEFTKYADVLNAEMDSYLDMIAPNPGKVTGCDLTRFAEVFHYAHGDSVITLYDFRFAFPMAEPTGVGLAGGMYIDSQLRIQGFGPGQFAVMHAANGSVRHVFMGSDFYYTAEEAAAADNLDWAMERINSAFGLGE